MALLRDILSRARKSFYIHEEPWAFWSQLPKRYQQPAPGSCPLPQYSSRYEDTYYNSRFMTDTQHLPPSNYVDVNTNYGPLRLQKVQDRSGSKGQNIPAVFEYDKTGLRCQATATWAALDASLAKVAPNHFPKDYPTNAELQEREVEYAAKGRPWTLPLYRWKRVSDHVNTFRY